MDLLLSEDLPDLPADDVPALLHIADLPVGHGRSPLVIRHPLWYGYATAEGGILYGQIRFLRKALQKEKERAERKAPELLGSTEPRHEEAGESKSI